MVLKRFVAVVLIASLLGVVVPVDRAEASHTYVSDLGTFTLSGSGVTKLSNATEAVRLGTQIMQFGGRWVGPVSLALAVAEIGFAAWDWYRHTYAPPSPLPSAVTGGSWQWGVIGTQSLFAYSVYLPAYYSGCGGTIASFQWNVDPSTIAWSKVVGGKVVDWHCGYPDVIGGQLVYLYLQSSGGTAANPFTGATVQKDRQAAIADMVAYRDALVAGAPLPNNIAAIMAANGEDALDPRQSAINALNAAIDVINYGVGLNPGEATVSGPGQAAAVPSVVSGTGTGSSTQAATGGGAAATSVGTSAAGGTDLTATNKKLDDIDSKLSAAPSNATPFVCPSCVRVDTWSTLFTSIQSAAAAAPIFGLIGRLAWPGSGTIQRQWALGSWQGGALSVDLDNSGVGTAITVVRFVVVGGAVILAYMIIFG